MFSPESFVFLSKLSSSPLFGLTLTLLAYLIAMRIYRYCRQSPLANPVLIAMLLVVLFLILSNTSYESYFQGAQMVHFLLGPATVALAIPLYAQWQRLKRMAAPLLLALVAGSLAAIFSATWLAKMLGASKASVLSLGPKSVTTPIAMGVAEKIGGIPSLTAVIVIITGIIGAVGGRKLYQFLRIDDHAIQGFAMGVAAHGIGTARAFQVSMTCGAFSALAMGLNGLFTAALLPYLLQWLPLF